MISKGRVVGVLAVVLHPGEILGANLISAQVEYHRLAIDHLNSLLMSRPK